MEHGKSDRLRGRLHPQSGKETSSVRFNGLGLDAQSVRSGTDGESVDHRAQHVTLSRR